MYMSTILSTISSVVGETSNNVTLLCRLRRCRCDPIKRWQGVVDSLTKVVVCAIINNNNNNLPRRLKGRTRMATFTLSESILPESAIFRRQDCHCCSTDYLVRSQVGKMRRWEKDIVGLGQRKRSTCCWLHLRLVRMTQVAGRVHGLACADCW